MKEKGTVYIAGPISDNPNYRFDFGWADFHLDKAGFRVLSPASLPEGMTRAQYMRICFAMIDTADVCIFLPGWERSGGASLEYDYCHYTGKRIGFVSDAEENEFRLSWVEA